MVSNVGGTSGTSGAGEAPIPRRSAEQPIEVLGTASSLRPDDRFDVSHTDRSQASFRTTGTGPADPQAQTRDKAAGTAETGIDESYLAELEAKIAAAYPADGRYPDEVYQNPPDLGPPRRFENRDPSPYNPLGLHLPRRLERYYALYDGKKVNVDGTVESNDRLSMRSAITTHLELVKQYNLAYVAMLRAANGSEQALAELKAAFAEGKIFDIAGTPKASLNRGEDQRLLQAMLGHLSLDILRSPDPDITTAARIGALEMVRDHFDVDAIAKAVVAEGESGIMLHYRDHAGDLIPQTFQTNAERNLSHTQSFWENAQIKQILDNRDDDGWKTDIEAAVNELSLKYRKETVQTLVSFLRYPNARVDGASVFRALIGLTELEGPRRQRIFGQDASYRNNGVSRDNSTVDEGDVDEGDISRMTRQQVVALIRRLASERGTAS